MVLKMLLLVLSVLLNVAFFTLLERKVLAYIQLRKGPNKVGPSGVFQPFSDAVKLFTKEGHISAISDLLMFALSPIIALSLSIIMWFSLPSLQGDAQIQHSVVFLLACISLGVYPLMLGGWASNSKYSLLGALRTVSQTLSYEVSLVIILMSVIIIWGSTEIRACLTPVGAWLGFLVPIPALLWFISTLAETHRTPFDLGESESELVSGYNTEYASSGFALYFLAEYSSILVMSMLLCCVFFNPAEKFPLVYPFLVLGAAIMFIWVRGVLPRVRYDKLMALGWKKILPMSLGFLVFICGLLQITCS